MSLRVRFQYATGSTLGFSIERLPDGLLFDFADSTFKASPGTLTHSLPEDTGAFAGRYKYTLASTPGGQFTDGDYCVTVHNTGTSTVVGELAAVMHNGDDATAIPGAGGSDPLANAVPGSYAAGTAGAALGLTLQTLTRYAGLVLTGTVASVSGGSIACVLDAPLPTRLTAAGLADGKKLLGFTSGANTLNVQPITAAVVADSTHVTFTTLPAFGLTVTAGDTVAILSN